MDLVNVLNKCWDTHVEPVNKMLSEGVEVDGVWDTTNIPDIVCRFGTTEDNPTHKALLIQIEPIKKETAEEILAELIDRYHPDDYDGTDKSFFELITRAKKVLGDE